jgi:spore maturation protein CgeB
VHPKILSQVEMSAKFQECTYNINLLTVENYDFTNLRQFEVAASGGLLLTPRNAEASKFFSDRKSALMFDNTAEINKIINDTSLDLNLIKRNGYDAIVKRSKNSFGDRFKSIMSEIELI